MRSSSPIHESRRCTIALAALSAALTCFFYWRWDPLHHPFPDDTGIVFRYLDNFRHGAFFTYSAADGPTFGISGFLHGVLAGGLARAQVSPEVSVVISNLLGAFCFFFCVGRLFGFLYQNITAAVIATLAVGVSSEFIPTTFFLGLETPLHLALVVFLVYQTCTRGRWFHLAAALTIISKLDSLALVVCLVGFHALRAMLESREARRQELRRLALELGLPLGLWCVFAALVFGSPVPQTLIAKMFHQSHPAGWFPFLQGFIGEPRRAITFALVVIASLLCIPYALYKRKPLHPAPVLSLCALLTLLQYYVYNPAEQMPWYYTLPEALLLISAASLLSIARDKAVAIPFFACAIAIVAGRSVLPVQRTGWTHRWLDCVEGERIRIGEDTYQSTPAGGVAVTGFGHIARGLKDRYVVDYSGLNSRGATARQLDLGRILSDYHAQTAVVHGLYDSQFLRGNHMRLDRTYYATRLAGFQTLNAFSVTPEGSDEAASYISSEAMHGGAFIRSDLWHSLIVAGKHIDFDVTPVEQDVGDLLEVRFGVVQKATPFSVRVQVDYDIGDEERTCQIPALANAACGGLAAVECRIPLFGTELPPVVRVTSSLGSLVIVEPIVLRRIQPLAVQSP